MQFGKAQKQKFQTSVGAYSLVTRREYIDSQITLTDSEAALLISHFGRENILVGNVRSNPSLASKSFRLHPTGNLIRLNVCFPKPLRTELRLYLSESAGFKPKGGHIWFMFPKRDDLWIGAYEEKEWRLESSEYRKDEYEDFYQEAVNSSNLIETTRLRERDVFKRDGRIAIQRIEMSSFKCEYDTSHKTFESRFTRRPYLEAHHLVPMGLQGAFQVPLDTIDNVFCLCPYCHRAVHHAKEDVARGILETLADKRPVLRRYSLTTTDLFNLYAIEEII